MLVLPRPSPSSMATSYRSALQSLLLTVLPQGGQHVARRNAWAGMARDAQLARARRDAGRAIHLAVAAADHPRARSAR